MELKLEDSTAAHLVVPKGRRDVIVWDTEQEGLFLRKFATGRVVYGVRYFVAGKPGQKTLREHVAGIRGQVTKARDLAADVRAKARLGTDVLADERAKKAEAAAQGATLAKLVPDFLAARKDKWRKSYYDTVELHLTEHLKGLASTPIKAITRQDIVDELDEVEAERGPVAADRCKASIGTFYTWAIDKGYADATPVVKIKARGKSGGRDRVLSPAELAEVWHALDEVNLDYRRVVRLLILTAQRRNEIGLLPWAEVNLAESRLELPGGTGTEGRTKNHRSHLVPLSPLALAQLPNAPDRADPTAPTNVFGRRAHSGYSGWGKSKAELDAAIAEARRKQGVAEDMPHWTLHDLRRTAVTLIAEQKIAPPHVIEAIVNHVSGHKAGVAGVYNKALYWDERVRALDAWAQYVEGLTRK